MLKHGLLLVAGCFFLVGGALSLVHCWWFTCPPPSCSLPCPRQMTSLFFPHTTPDNAAPLLFLPPRTRANARNRHQLHSFAPHPLHVVSYSSSSSSFPFAPLCVCVCVCVCALHVHPMQRHALSPPARVHAFFHSSLYACVCMLGMLCPPPLSKGHIRPLCQPCSAFIAPFLFCFLFLVFCCTSLAPAGARAGQMNTQHNQA